MEATRGGVCNKIPSTAVDGQWLARTKTPGEIPKAVQWMRMVFEKLLLAGNKGVCCTAVVEKSKKKKKKKKNVGGVSSQNLNAGNLEFHLQH